MNKFGIYDKELDMIISVLNKYPQIERAKIFGSRAKGNFKRYSDVDIAVFGDSAHDLSRDISYDLDDLYIIYKCDVLHYEKTYSTEIKEHIDRVGVVFYERAEYHDR